VTKVRTVAQHDVTQLVQQHQAEVWRYLRFLGASPELADDLCQETFLQLLRAPYEEQCESARKAWLRTVARNLFVKSFRHPPFATVELDQMEQSWQSFAQDDGGDETLEQLQQCLQQLDGRARDALRLHYEDRRSRREIGERLAIGEQGVKSLLRRSRELLRQCVARARGQV
jgi:RNA polymerase sigma-70 factor, ECF subfamily